MQRNTIRHKPESPKTMHHHERNRRIGELLRAGHSFRDAMRMVDREFDRYQAVAGVGGGILGGLAGMFLGSIGASNL